MAFCVECDEEYPDARLDHPMLADTLARYHCVMCWDKRVSKRDIQRDFSTRLVLDHKSGYKLVRNADDCKVYSTGKPNVRTF